MITFFEQDITAQVFIKPSIIHNIYCMIRPIVLHLLLFLNTAQKIVEQNPELADLTNLDIFLVARNVELTLAQQQTQAALAWIHDHKSKLRKIKSTLEFRLRQQEFVELIKTDRRMDAVRHARKYLTNMEDVPWDEVQRCTALLAFPADTSKKCSFQCSSCTSWF